MGGQCEPVGRGAGGMFWTEDLLISRKRTRFLGSSPHILPHLPFSCPKKGLGAHNYFIGVISDSYRSLLFVSPSQEIKENEMSPRGTHLKCPSPVASPAVASPGRAGRGRARDAHAPPGPHTQSCPFDDRELNTHSLNVIQLFETLFLKFKSP